MSQTVPSIAAPRPRHTQAFLPSLTQLRAFVEVARLDSISRAAEELRRSQSAVTQAVQSLEAELGVPLFARTSTGSYLTDMGRILQARADRCFERIEAVLGDILEAGDKAQTALIARRVTRAQVLALTAAHEYGSFAQAAHHAQVSLTSLQRAARSLETQLKRALFTKTAQGLVINPTGIKLANELNLAVRELEWAEEEIKSHTGALRGRLLVGSLLLAGNNYISAGLDRFVVANPGVRVRLVNGPYDELLSKLRSGAIDFLVGALKPRPPVDDVSQIALGEDPYVIAVSRDHPLAGAKEVSRSDLLEAEWIAPGPGAQRRAVFEGIFEDGPLPFYSVETHSLLTIFVLLAQSRRLAVLTESEIALGQRMGQPLERLSFHIAHPPARLGVTVRSNWTQSRLQQTFLRSLQQHP